MKKRSERRKHCVLAVVRRSQKYLLHCMQTPSRGHGTAKIYTAGDGHYLYLQTQFGEDRCTQFRVIVVTGRQTYPETHTQTNKQTHTQDRLQYTAPLKLSAQCNYYCAAAATTTTTCVVKPTVVGSHVTYRNDSSRFETESNTKTSLSRPRT